MNDEQPIHTPLSLSKGRSQRSIGQQCPLDLLMGGAATGVEKTENLCLSMTVVMIQRRSSRLSLDRAEGRRPVGLAEPTRGRSC